MAKDLFPDETVIWGGTAGHPYTTTSSPTGTFNLDTVPAGATWEGEIVLQGGHAAAAAVGADVSTPASATPASQIVAALRIQGTTGGVTGSSVNHVRIVAGTTDAAVSVAAASALPSNFRAVANGVLV